VGDPYLLDFVADQRLGPAVEWQLRNFENATWVDGLDSQSLVVPAGRTDISSQETYQLSDFVVILTPADMPLSLEEGYVGQDFAIRADCNHPCQF
jgi:hypothetical protein